MSSWTQRLVSVLAVVALAGLPVAATVCNAMCEVSDAHMQMAEHEASAASCHETASPAGSRLEPAPAHDCGTHDGATRDAEAALMTSSVTMAQLLAVVVLPALAQPVDLTSAGLSSASMHGPPPGAASAHTSLVLRI